jgi:hypothetical protein
LAQGCSSRVRLSPKDKGKTQIAAQISKLAKASDVERERAAWKVALAQLAAMLDG